MRYLLDKNILTNDLLTNSSGRMDLCVTEDVLAEAGLTKKEIAKLTTAGLKVIKVTRKHLDKLKEVLTVHGSNFKLINLYTGKGTADVMMIAYILVEHDDPESLFPEEYSIVTKDKELINVAKSYGIRCVSQID